jgi:hypothetical protein
MARRCSRISGRAEAGSKTEVFLMAKSQTKRNEAVALSASRAATASLPATVTDGDIARRAYDLYLARGCETGHDVDDWLRAERELRGTVSSAA